MDAESAPSPQPAHPLMEQPLIHYLPDQQAAPGMPPAIPPAGFALAPAPPAVLLDAAAAASASPPPVPQVPPVPQQMPLLLMQQAVHMVPPSSPVISSPVPRSVTTSGVINTEKQFRGSGDCEPKILSAPSHPHRLLSQLNLLRLDRDYCDLVLIAEQAEFPVHKTVVVACSDYFRAMMSSDMRESRENIVTLRGLSAAGLKAIIDFAYTGSLSLSMNNVEDVLSAASHLQVLEAMELCTRYLEWSLNANNCVDLLNMAELYCLGKLRQRVRSFLLENFEEFGRSTDLYKLSAQQLADLLQEDALRVSNEFCVFQIVRRWLDYSYEDRVQHVASFIRHVRMCLFTGEELVEKVSHLRFMREVSECRELLTEAKDYHIVVRKQPLMQSPRTQVRNDQPSIVMCHAENLEAYNVTSRRHTFLKDCPTPLYNPCITVVDNFLYACGGRFDCNENSEIASARCFRYDPRFDSWLELCPMNEARKDFVMVALHGDLFAIGGQDENMVMCTVERYSVPDSEWRFQASLRHAVYCHAGTVCDGRIYISGGQRYDGFCATLSCYSESTSNTAAGSGSSQVCLNCGGGAQQESTDRPATSVCICGTSTSSSSSNTSNSSALQGFWEEKTAMLSKRGNHVMEAVGGRIYVLGGNLEDAYGFPVPIVTVESYEPRTDQWTLLSGLLNIRECGSCVHDTKIYVAGGLDGEHYFSHALQLYDSERDTVELVERFPTRIYGRVCCVMILPQYV